MKLNKKLGVLLAAITILALPTSIVKAKAGAIVIVGKDSKYYEYNYTDLKASATSSVLGDTVNGVLYQNFLQNKDSIQAYYADVRNVYVSASVINQQAINSAITGAVFNFESFLENTNTSSTTITTVKVTKDSLANSTGGSSSDSNIVTFNDKNLERVVRNTINKSIGDIYKSDLEKITTLYAGEGNITNISGLENLTNLKELDLHTNKISDISSLKTLVNLQSLYLDGNKISDVSSLQYLTSLKKLYLGNNQISDISSLKSLTNLQQLYLDINQVSDISSLKSLTSLQQLHLENNKISYISPLSVLTNLQMLYLESNQISDISSLKGLTTLKELYLYDNLISDADKKLLQAALMNCKITFK